MMFYAKFGTAQKKSSSELKEKWRASFFTLKIFIRAPQAIEKKSLLPSQHISILFKICILSWFLLCMTNGSLAFFPMLGSDASTHRAFENTLFFATLNKSCQKCSYFLDSLIWRHYLHLSNNSLRLPIFYESFMPSMNR